MTSSTITVLLGSANYRLAFVVLGEVENGEAKLVHYFIIIIIIYFIQARINHLPGWGLSDSLRASRLRAVSFRGSIDYIPIVYHFFLCFFLHAGPLLSKSSSFHVWATKPMLHLTWPSHNLTSSYWMPSLMRRESEVALSFALILQITSIVSLQAVHCVCCHC